MTFAQLKKYSWIPASVVGLIGLWGYLSGWFDNAVNKALEDRFRRIETRLEKDSTQRYWRQRSTDVHFRGIDSILRTEHKVIEQSNY